MMTIYDNQHHFEHLICCPITHQDLRLMSEDELASANDLIADRRLFYFNTAQVKKSLTAGFVTTDKTIVYPVAEDIVLLLPDFAIALTADRFKNIQVPEYQLSVQEFYDTIGWKRSENGHYEDARRYEDLRPVSQDYVHKCHLRVNDYLPPHGTYILDVASGPIQYPAYLTYSENFDIRVCVDISFPALIEARKTLPPGHGLFIQANIGNLPFKPAVFDAIVSLHTVYHIAADQQHATFDELHRVLKSKGKAVVVYTWGNTSLLNKPYMYLSKLKECFRRLFPFGDIPQTASGKPTFYYHPHTCGWFKHQTWDYKFETICWRSISVKSMKLFIHKRLFGKQLLRIAFSLEEKFPKFMACLGQYPMFVIEKE